jgi:hypothetical protein
MNDRAIPETSSAQRITRWKDVAERLEDATRISMQKTGADRQGWIEDARYWRLILDRLTLKAAAPTPLPSVLEEWNADADAAKASGGEMPNDPQ